MKKTLVIVICLVIFLPTFHCAFADDTSTSTTDIIDASSTDATTTDNTITSTSTTDIASSTDSGVSTTTVATNLGTVHLDVRYQDTTGI